MTDNTKFIHRTIYCISLLVLLLTGLFISYLSYLLWFQDNPASEIRNLPIPIELSDGQTYITTSIDLCVYTDAPGSIQYAFVNHIVYTMPPQDTVLKSTGSDCRVYNRRFNIPEELPDGVYHLEGKTTYEVNALATRTQEWSTQEFTLNRGIQLVRTTK